MYVLTSGVQFLSKTVRKVRAFHHLNWKTVGGKTSMTPSGVTPRFQDTKGYIFPVTAVSKAYFFTIIPPNTLGINN